AEVIERIRHHAERISKLVPDAARELSENGESFAPNELLLCTLQSLDGGLQFTGPGCHARFELALRLLDLVGHPVERLGEQAKLVTPNDNGATGIIPARDVLRRV